MRHLGGRTLTCTAQNNNCPTCTQEINKQLKEIPFKPKYIAHKFTEYTYPIQNKGTRKLIDAAKAITQPKGLYLLGRFAEWEYYNMDGINIVISILLI